MDEGERIKSVVREMAKLGYDVKVETVCRSCAESLKAELHPNEPDYWTAYKEGKKYHVSVCDINFLFSFRTSPDVEYHRAIANNEDYYVSLLSLLKNSPMYFLFSAMGHPFQQLAEIMSSNSETSGCSLVCRNTAFLLWS